MPIVNGKEVLANSPEFQATRNARGGIDKTSARETSGVVTAGTTGMGAAQIQPTVSANELVNPPAQVNPPVPAVNTNDGSRTASLVNNVAASNQQFIGDNLEARKRANEINDIMGSKTFNAAEQRTEFSNQLGLPDFLARRQDIQTQLTQANTASTEQKVNLGGIRGMTEDRIGREVTTEDRLNAVRNAGLAAEAAVLQGSIETATTLVNSAMQDFYQDRQLQNQNMINQLNYFQGIAGEQTAQLLGQEARKYEEDQAKVNRVLDNIDTALNSGAASVEDIRNLTNPKLSDDERLTIAQNVISRAATEERNLQIQQTNASIRSANAVAALNEAELVAFNKAQDDAAAGILSPEQMEVANDVNKDFESQPVVKDYNAGLQKYIVLEDTLANGIDGIQDLQLVYDFMKAVDPTSVVRETEFDNAAKTGNIFQGAFARFNKSFGSGGFLPPEVKADFTRAARMSFEARNSQYFNVKSEYAKRMNNTLGINNGADYLTAYEGAAPLTQSDISIAEIISGASEQDIQDVMLMTEGLLGNSNGLQGAAIFK